MYGAGIKISMDELTFRKKNENSDRILILVYLHKKNTWRKKNATKHIFT